MVQQAKFKTIGGNMALNSMRIFLAVTLLSFGVSGQASVVEEMNADYLTLGSVEVARIEVDVLGQEIAEKLSYSDLKQSMSESDMAENKSAVVQDAGKIIATGRELVALGEDIYRLVVKGKPQNITSYAPVSIIPKFGDSYVDIFDTENWSAPRKNTYEINYKNLYGMTVVKFRYSVIYSYGGTYNGKGAYITGAHMVPDSVMTSWGFTFSATMKLNSLTNLGTKERPVAGAVLAMEYTVETILQASLETDSYYITGRGGFKAL